MLADMHYLKAAVSTILSVVLCGFFFFLGFSGEYNLGMAAGIMAVCCGLYAVTQILMGGYHAAPSADRSTDVPLSEDATVPAQYCSQCRCGGRSDSGGKCTSQSIPTD